MFRYQREKLLVNHFWVNMHVLHTTQYTFHKCWQGEFGYLSRASLVRDHFLYSCDLNVWLTVDAVRRNEMFCTLRGQTVKTGACRDHLTREVLDNIVYIVFTISETNTVKGRRELRSSYLGSEYQLSAQLLAWLTDQMTNWQIDWWWTQRQIGSLAVNEQLEALMSRPWWKGREKVVLS